MATNGEASALLGGDATPKRVTREREGHATMISCVSNLCNTIMGTGMLTFPLAMSSAGILPGMFTCLFSGSVAAFGLYLLSLCAVRTPHRRSSFFAVAKLTFPNAAVFFDSAIAIKCFGVSVSYLIIIKSLMPNVVASIYHDLTSPDTNPPEWALSGRLWITIFMSVLIPLAFMRRLDSLRHTSYVALFAIAYLVVIVISCYFSPVKGTISRGEVKWVNMTPKFISTFPVQVFAFTCAQNLFPMFNEVANNTQKRMNIIIGSSIGTATLTYEVIAVFGYLTFGSKVGANIIAMYPSTSLFIAVGQLAIVILVLFSYPLQVHPCRNCLDKVFHTAAASTEVTFDVVSTRTSTTALPEDEDAETVLSVQAEEDEGIVDEDHAGGDMSPLKHAVITTAIIASGFGIAYFVDDLQMVLSFVGSTGSTTISFILPGLFYWKLTKDDANRSKFLSGAALGLAAYGAFIFVFCLGFNIYNLFAGSPAGPAH